MHSPETLKRHAALMDRMSEKLGVDLEEAVLTGLLRFDEVADAVLRCASCSNPEHCAGWLAESAARDAPPGYCRNTELFAALREGVE
jgi:hypothetical protein